MLDALRVIDHYRIRPNDELFAMNHALTLSSEETSSSCPGLVMMNEKRRLMRELVVKAVEVDRISSAVTE